MTFVLLTVALSSAALPAAAAPSLSDRAMSAHGRNSSLVRTGSTPVVTYQAAPQGRVVAPAEAPDAPASKPWMLLVGGAAAIAMAMRRRQSIL